MKAVFLLYINPGEGTLFWQCLLGISASAAFFGKELFFRIINRIRKIFSKNKTL